MGKEKSEKSKKQEKQNRTSGKSVLKFILSVAGLIGIYLAYRTLIEMKTQREKAYEPELIILDYFGSGMGSTEFFDTLYRQYDIDLLTWNRTLDSSVISHEIRISDGKKTGRWSADFDRGNQMKIPIINIGLGPAINIESDFSFDTNYFIGLFNKHNPIKIPDTAYIDSGNLFLVRVYDTTIIHENKPYDQFQYIAPKGQSNDTAWLSPPSGFFKLLSLRHYLIWRNHISFIPSPYPKDTFLLFRDPIQKFPPLKATLKFSDMNGIQYRSMYEIDFSAKAGIYAFDDLFLFRDNPIKVKYLGKEKITK